MTQDQPKREWSRTIIVHGYELSNALVASDDWQDGDKKADALLDEWERQMRQKSPEQIKAIRVLRVDGS